MPRQVLNRFRICAGVNLIRDVCVAQLVWSYLKIKGIHHITIKRCIFTHPQFGAVILPLFQEVLPESLRTGMPKGSPEQRVR